jgi:hypothetical protein
VRGGIIALCLAPPFCKVWCSIFADSFCECPAHSSSRLRFQFAWAMVRETYHSSSQFSLAPIIQDPFLQAITGLQIPTLSEMVTRLFTKRGRSVLPPGAHSYHLRSIRSAVCCRRSPALIWGRTPDAMERDLSLNRRSKRIGCEDVSFTAPRRDLVFVNMRMIRAPQIVVRFCRPGFPCDPRPLINCFQQINLFTVHFLRRTSA